MKAKGINPIEQNIEKIVLGVAGAALVAVVAMQVLGGSSVEVGSKSYPLDQAYTPVRDEALRVQGAMQNPSPTLPDVPVVDLLGRYRELVAAPVADQPRVVAFGPGIGVVSSGRVDDTPVGDAIYAAVNVPAPARPMGYSFRNTLDPVQVSRTPGLTDLVPVAQPYDKSSITVESVFDGVAFERMLRADPDGPGGPARAMPLRWWQDGLEIMAVRAERQVRLPGGAWSDPQPVSVMPGSFDVTAPPEGQAQFNPVTLRTAVVQARQLSREVQRPRYLRVIAGQPWVPPSAAGQIAAIEARRAEIDRLLGQRRGMEREIRRLELTIEQGPRNNTPTTPTVTPGRDGRSPERPAQPTQPNNRPPQVDPAIQAMQTQMDRLRQQLVQNEDALKQIGVGLDGKPIPTWDDDNELGYAPPVLEDAEVRLWVHDLNVEPGMAYRYRMQVVFNNPFFGNAAALVPDQQSLAAEPMLAGAWSAWSDPVSVDQTRYIFATSASVADDIGATPRAQFDVFEFYYGYWRRGQASMSAGDQLIARLNLPDPEMRPIYDLEQAPAPRQPGGVPGTRSPGERIDPVPGRSDPGVPIDPLNRNPQGAPPGAPGLQFNLPDVAALAQPGPESLGPIATGVILLDVMNMPAGAESGLAGVGVRQITQAVLRSAHGRIEVRSPSIDRAAALYRSLIRSAEEGMRQGAPEPEAFEPDPIVLPRNSEPELEEPGSGGGGGGGGGS
ncbi:MAG: hypothetical protein R3B68_14375 [Phycisphaerales bacterium]